MTEEYDPRRPRRARDPVERPARRRPVEHDDADPLQRDDAAAPDHGRGRPARARAPGRAFPERRRSRWTAELGRDATRRRARRRWSPELVLHAAAWTDVDGAEDDPQGAAAVNVGGTQHAAALGAPLVAYSTDYVFDGRQARAVRRVRRAEPARRRTAARSCTARRPRASGRGSSAPRGCSARRATTSSARCCGWAASGTRSRSSTTSAAARRTSATWPPRRGRSSGRGRPSASATSPRTATAPGPSFAEAIFEEAGLDCRVRRDHDGRARRAGAAAGVLGAAQRERRRPSCRTGATACEPASSGSPAGPRSTPLPVRAPRYPSADARARHRRRRVHRLALRQAARRGAGEEVVVLDKLTYAGNPRQPRGRRARVPRRRHRRRRGGRAGRGRLRRDRQLRRRDARRPLDPRRRRSSSHGRARHAWRCSSWARAHDARFVQVSTDEVYGDLEAGGRSREGRPAAAVEPLQRREGGGRPAGARRTCAPTA